MTSPKTANTTVNTMNFRTIAFNKGFLLVKNYSETDLTDEEYYNSLATVDPIVINLQIELMRFGYMFDKDAMLCLSKMDHDELLEVSNSLVDYLADAYGDGCFVTLFGDFPHTVLKMSELEMFIHQIVHYLSGGAYSPAMPSCGDAELASLHASYDNVILRDTYKLIKPISYCDFAEYFKNILAGQQSLTDYDKKAVEYLCGNYKKLGVSFGDVFPEDIPFKETLCLVIANTEDYMPKTITDVLRYAVYLSGGDISLPALPSAVGFGWTSYMRRNNRYRNYYEEELKKARRPFNFIKFSRGQRRDILEMMEYVINNSSWDNVAADMKKYLGRWTRLGELLHPGEFAKKYPKTSEMFTLVRNSGQYISTYGGRLRAAREANDFGMLLTIYKERPGELLRNIDNLLRNYEDHTEEILAAVKYALEKASTKMLYELLDYFNMRNDDISRRERFVVVKGARSAYNLPCLPEMDENTRLEVLFALEEELDKRFAAKGDMTNKIVLLEDSLADIALPKNMRSMNFMPGQQARGSRIKIDNKTGILRCYCRWTDKLGEYDLDLSTQFFDENFKYKTSISWNTGYRRENWAIFSGDVIRRKGNCAEYIDVDINGAIAAGCRYLVASVNDFSGGGFALKDTWAGVMERDTFGTPGEVTWAPETITTGFRLTSVCTNVVMAIIDLWDMYMYVVDEDTTGVPVASQNLSVIGTILKRYMYQNRYFNALSMMTTNFKIRNANVKVLTSEKFAEQVKWYDDMRKKYKKMIHEYEEILADTSELLPSKVEDLRKTKETLEGLYNDIKNNVIKISYNDIANDYTSLLQLMF